MKLIRIINWEKYQNYKHRRPPWVKVHRKILDSRQIMSIADASFGLLVKIWLLVSDSDEKIDGTIKMDFDCIAFKLHKTTITIEDLQPLIDSGLIEIIDNNGDSLSIASENGCLQSSTSARTETETETETEKEKINKKERNQYELEQWKIKERKEIIRSSTISGYSLTEEEIVKTLENRRKCLM